MEKITITKNGKTRTITKYAWENLMPANKNGWEIKPKAPKEIKELKELKVEKVEEVKVETQPEPKTGKGKKSK
jgi:hypothetical protein